MNNISDITNAFYINLDCRPDRKMYVEDQLNKIGIKAQRCKAIKLENGSIGCSLSHLNCLQFAFDNDWEHVLIVEDDITFLLPELFIKQFNNFLENNNDWDVLLLGGNVIPPYKEVNKYCVKVEKCQTTTGYLVKKHYYQILIDNIKVGLKNLIKNPELHSLYAIDKFWFTLQQRDKWYLIIPLTVVQKPGYSDIEKKNTNYQALMKDLNKVYLKR